MITRLGTAPRARGLDYLAFQRHWQSAHADVARDLPGLRRYVQNHAILRDGRPILSYPGFDACSELDFEGIAAMDRAFSSAHYRSSVAEDERELIDRERLRPALMSRRTIRSGSTAGEAVKLMTFWQLDPQASIGELDRLLAGPARIDAQAAGALRHEQMIEIPGAHDSRTPPACAAVDMLWFEASDDALRFLSGEQAHSAAWILSGVGRGATYMIAREVTVVDFDTHR